MGAKSKTPEYKTWDAMIRRCTDSNHEKFHCYGGRGIRVCKRWIHSFENFFKDMGNRPEGKSIERINNDGNYGPLNCRWATKIEQENNKRTSTKITFGGITLTLADWARKLGLKKNTIVARIVTHKMPLEKALTPIKLKTGPKKN